MRSGPWLPRATTLMMEFGPLSETGDGRDVGGRGRTGAAPAARERVLLPACSHQCACHLDGGEEGRRKEADGVWR